MSCRTNSPLSFLLPGIVYGGMIVSSAAAQQNSLGMFAHHSDVGNPQLAGSALYDDQRQEYEISGAGANMWAEGDECHFVWKRMRGDFVLRARMKFLGEGVDPHRKIGWMVRRSLEADSTYADVALHGDGLTSLQFRRTAGSKTEEVQSPVSAPDVIQLERKGSSFKMSVAQSGEALSSEQITDLDLGDHVYVGLFVCSHNPAVREQARFDNVRIIVPAKDDFVPYRDYIGSNLEILDVESGRRTLVSHVDDSLQAPNWTRDGKALIYNRNGLLYRFDLAMRTAEPIDTDFATNNNNDHVLSFDGQILAISHQDPANGHRSVIYTVPTTGGTPTQITPGDVLNDGPEYTPDGKTIYFNSSRSGTMEVWRMNTDGSDQRQVTDDPYNNWFPHVSPDGKWIVFVSFPADVPAEDHPFYQHVTLRLMPAAGGDAKVIAYVYGGQGTLNVPSWSPDSRSLAFVSNTDRPELATAEEKVTGASP